MKLLKLLVVVGLSSTVMVSGCATSAPAQADKIIDSPYGTAVQNQQQDDQGLKHKLQDSIDAQLKGSDIRVMVSYANVLLVGQAPDASSKEQATALVKIWPNVKKVFNYITINPMPSLNSSSAVSNEVSKRVGQQKDLLGSGIQVITVDGVVYLMGSNIGNLTALNTAIQGIYSIERVSKVVNLVQKADQDYYTH